MYNPFAFLWSNKQLIFNFTKREIESRYKGSLFGKMWVVIHHLSLLLIYTFVFSFILQTKVKTNQGDLGVDFALWLYCGLLPWLALNESIAASVRDIISKTNYVKKIVFPLEVFPIVTVVSALFNMMIGLLMLLVGLLLLGGGLHWTALYLLLALPALFLLMSGISLLLSSLGVYLRDLGQVVGLVSMLWMYGTPILYTDEVIPDRYRWIFELNPLTHLVNYFRDALFWGKEPDLIFLLWFTALSTLLFCLGVVVFRKIKKGFADVL